MCIFDDCQKIIKKENEKIFQKGFRGSASKKKEGTGVGLFLAKKLAKQIGGDLSLLENLKSVGEIIVKDERERISKIHDLISKFALDNVQEVKAKFLSGGQRRKLVICMALLGDPKILLCDEIFAALDLTSSILSRRR